MKIYRLLGLAVSAEPNCDQATLRRVVSVAACVVACCFVATPADSSTMYWTGGQGNWNADEYWFEGSVGDRREPGADDVVLMGSSNRSVIVIVDRAGEVARSVWVGHQGAATLQIVDNGELTTFQTDIGGSPYGGEGGVSVTGPNASWTNEAGLTVGAFNPYTSRDYLDLPGWLTVSEGGVVSSGSGLIGSSTYSDGWAHVDGTSSLWSNQGDLVVGARGNGDLRVSRGGRVLSEKGIVGQDSIYGSGTATVTGALSRWDSRGELRVGGSGEGLLSIERGGVVSNELGTIGRFAGSSGTVEVSGAFSTWSSSGDTMIGVRGRGGLEVSEGGTVLTHGDGIVGRYEESSGYVSLIGEGSSWNVTNNLYLGYLGTSEFYDGNLSVWSGATVSSADLYVGYGGRGLLSVLTGSRLDSAAGYIGFEGGATGEVTVAGDGATWTNADVLYVGGSGNGVLNIRGGGTVTNTTGYLAQQAGTTGEVTVTGPGASWIQSGRLNVGLKGHGTLLVADGGRVESDWAGITVEAGSTGAATITGAGSQWVAERLYVGGGGTGSLDVLNGGRFETPSFITVWGFGTVTVAGGTIDAATINHQSGGEFHFTGGTLRVGTFNGNLQQQGGTLAPGNSPGTMTINGDYSLDAGELQIELAGLKPDTEYDLVSVAGNLTLAGDLSIELLDSFVPSSTDTFTVLTAGDMQGAFANVASGERLGVTSGPSGSFVVNYGAGSLYDPNIIVLSSFALNRLPGDFDLDGDVDGRDFLLWQRDLSVGNLIDWQANFGNTAALVAANTAVPEPSGLLLLLYALATAAGKFRLA